MEGEGLSMEDEAFSMEGERLPLEGEASSLEREGLAMEGEDFRMEGEPVFVEGNAPPQQENVLLRRGLTRIHRRGCGAGGVGERLGVSILAGREGGWEGWAGRREEGERP